MPPRRRAGAQVAAVRADLGKLPEELRTVTEAVAAVALAMNIDAGEQVVASVKELRATMTGLRARGLAINGPAKQASVPEPVKESPVADLMKKIDAARRRPSAG